MLRYDKYQIAIVNNIFLEYKIDEDLTKIVVEGARAPQIQLEFKYKLYNADSKVYKITEHE
jgi:hypothetical protein